MPFSNLASTAFKSVIISKFGITSLSQIEKYVKLYEGQTLDSIFVQNLEAKLYSIVSEKYGIDKAKEISLEVQLQLAELKENVEFNPSEIQILNSLGDESCRIILDSITDPIEESDIVKITKIPKTTVHRKIKQLLESNLIQGSTGVIKRNGKYVVKYKKSFCTINIKYISTNDVVIIN